MVASFEAPAEHESGKPAETATKEEQQPAAQKPAPPSASAQPEKPPAVASKQPTPDKAPQPQPTPATDPNSRDPAAMPKPQELATDKPSEVKVDEQKARPTEQAGNEAEEKAASAPQSEAERDNAQSSDDPGGQTLEQELAALQPTDDAAKEAAQPGQEKNDEPPAAITTVQPDEKPMTKAKKLYSSKDLAQVPKAVLAEWKKQPASVRIGQLCNSEEAGQLRAAGIHAIGLGQPAAAQTTTTNRSISTDAAFYQTRDGWYKIKFKCVVDAQALKVTEFSYILGESIPRSQWAGLGLPEF